jgi:hypothetical protein
MQKLDETINALGGEMKLNTLYICFLIFGLCWLGVDLVKTEHYGWAWIPFIFAGFVGEKSKK